MIGDTPDAPAMGPTLPMKRGPKSHLHPLDTMGVVLKLEDVLLLEFMSTADALRSLLQ